MRAIDRERILIELKSRLLRRYAYRSEKRPPILEETLLTSLYEESLRLDDDRESSLREQDRSFWDDVRRQMHQASQHKLQELVGKVVWHYADEIAGLFDEKVYRAVTQAGEPVLGALFNAVSPLRFMRAVQQKGPLGSLPRLDDAVVLRGHVSMLEKLRQRGTLLMVPTHVSHMDSIVVGYALYKMGFPPFLYGAGLNLFHNPVVGYFLRNLGAYSVDRKKRDPLYKEVLKEYATLTLENGYDNIFFPGGTRSRSGAVEKKLKLGLLSAGLGAFVNNLHNKREKPNIYIVPTTLSYQLVLEAETLIDDFLKEVGKARYIITDDEFSQPRRIFDFVRQLFSLDSKIVFHVGTPMDPFGNPVDENGESLDPCGRRIDAQKYVMRRGEVVEDAARDAEYTRALGAKVADAFVGDNEAQATHVTAKAVMNLLRQQNANIDLVRLLRTGGPVDDVPMNRLLDEVSRIRQALLDQEQQKRVAVDAKIRQASPSDIVADGLRHFAIYHTKPAAQRVGDRLIVPHRPLLFYYQNRLEGYGLEPQGLSPSLSDDHRTLGRTA